MDSHSISFFGQKTGIIMSSSAKTEDCVFFRFIKKKQAKSPAAPEGSGLWEKPSRGEGKTIKFNLGEILFILRVLKGKSATWSTVHKFNGDSTSIAVKTEGKNGSRNVQFFISGYVKYLKFPETKIMFDLLKHMYEEKIVYATGYSGEAGKEKRKHSKRRQWGEDTGESQKRTYKTNAKYGSDPMDIPVEKIITNPDKSSTNQTATNQNPSRQNGTDPRSGKSAKSRNSKRSPPSAQTNRKFKYIDKDKWLKNLENDGEYCLLPGEILSKRGKALSFQINGLNSVWLPLSQVKDAEFSDAIGGLWTKTWIVEKKLGKIFETA